MSELKLNTPLRIDEVDFRIQSINKGGYATILAYKSARVDYHRLNAVYGAGNWQRRHESIDGRLYCSVGVWHEKSNTWAWVQDVGTESNTEKEKGNASDSFKRACFNLGIGSELYDYPLISIKLNGGGEKPNGVEWFLNPNKKDRFGNPSPQAGYELKLKEWVWYSEFDEGSISVLAAKDEKGTMRFKWKSPVDNHRWKKGEKADILSSMGACLLDGDAEGVKEIYKKHSGDIEQEMKFFALFGSAERTIIKQYLSE